MTTLAGTVTAASQPLAGAEVFAFAGLACTVHGSIKDWTGTVARFVESAITDEAGQYSLPTGGTMLAAFKWSEGTPADVRAMLHDEWARDRQFWPGCASVNIDLPPAAARPGWFVMGWAGR